MSTVKRSTVSMPTVIRSIATANPDVRGSQKEAAAFMERVTSIPEGIRKRIPRIYEQSAIDFRYTCIGDYTREVDEFEFFPQSPDLKPAPTTSKRNAKYREAAIPLAENVATRALEEAGVRREEVTHVIAVSCTGFFAPGIDIELVKRLGLPAETQRTFIGFMGCYAAFNGLRVAHGFCCSDPNAVVLLVCVELCTLHFQVDDSLGSAVVNALFSDGAAAAVVQSTAENEADGSLAYLDGRTALHEDSMEDMTWEVGDTGFMMGLSSRVPHIIAGELPEYVDRLLGAHDLSRRDVGFWAIHPGGRAIVDRAQEVLELPDEAVHDSLEVLRLHGNMSSPTILFVLKRMLGRRQKEHGVALAFGPGLTIEGALFRRL